MKTELRIEKRSDGTVDVHADPEVMVGADRDADNPLAALLEAVEYDGKRVRITVESEELPYCDRFALWLEKHLT